MNSLCLITNRAVSSHADLIALAGNTCREQLLSLYTIFGDKFATGSIFRAGISTNLKKVSLLKLILHKIKSNVAYLWPEGPMLCFFEIIFFSLYDQVSLCY